MISDYLKKRFLNNTEPLATFTMEAREGYQVTVDSEASFKERLVVACLVSREGRYEIRFIPGVTGHEAYIFDNDFRKRVGEERARGPERSFFGEKINPSRGFSALERQEGGRRLKLRLRMFRPQRSILWRPSERIGGRRKRTPAQRKWRGMEVTL